MITTMILTTKVELELSEMRELLVLSVFKEWHRLSNIHFGELECLPAPDGLVHRQRHVRARRNTEFGTF